MSGPSLLSAAEVSVGFREGRWSATEIVEDAISRVSAWDRSLGAFTTITLERARSRAAALDAQRARGEPLGALAGAVFAAKNLFDIAGLPTLAGSRINRERPVASRDATLVERLEAQGAILLGALNMGEYAYDFTGENAHDGPSRNPHAPAHMAGGSSGGSATATAAGFVHLALASDTNGSIRVPSSFCGVFGLKPTYGRLSHAGIFPFASSLDHLGPMARSVLDLALAYDAMTGDDPRDPSQASRPATPAFPELEKGLTGLRIARAGGYFSRGAHPESFEAVERVARALGVTREVDLPESHRARAAAYLITMSEGAALHRERLQARPQDFEPIVMERLFAGSMVPAAWLIQAQKFRRYYRDTVRKVFEEVDVLLAPTTPCRAPLIGQQLMTLDGVEIPIRANLGIFTQPLSFIGVPVVNVPVWTDGERLPMGVQIIAPAWREDLALRVARWLEREGVTVAPVAALNREA